MIKLTHNPKLLILITINLMLALCFSLVQAQDLPPHWDNDDVGDVLADGEATFENDTFYLYGAGADIWEAADGFHYAYLPTEGDCEITAYIASVEKTSHDAKACVMIRETLDASSKFAMALACPGPGAGTYFQRRHETEATCDHDNLDHSQSAPVWVKLVRVENTFTASYSLDGETWLPTDGVSRDIEMEFEAYIGLGICGKAGDVLCEAKFANVVVETGIEYPNAIADQYTEDGFSVYPNPVTDNLTLVLDSYNENSFVHLYNNLGQLILKETVSGQTNILDLSDVPQGIYYVTLKNDDNSVVKKVIKE